MNIRFIKNAEKKEIIETLNEKFGISEIPYLLIESGREKIRAFSGHLSKEEITKISELTKIELVGAYFLKKENNDFRLSLDATIILKSQIKKNIIELDEKEANEWLHGLDIKKQKERDTYVIKFQNDFLGCTKSNTETLFNYMPKDRRLKNKLN